MRHYPISPILFAAFVMFFVSSASSNAAVCIECHRSFNVLKKIIHRPVADGNCYSCHNPHVAKHSGLLNEATVELCAKCHELVQENVAANIVHKPYLEGKCITCHNPHSSEFDNLLQENLSSLCFSCHKDIAKKFQYPHAPFKEGNCSICHQPHSSKEPYLLREKGDVICLSCHNKNEIDGKHPNSPIKVKACLSCHNPHGSSRKSIIREYVHPPFQDGCNSCHKGTVKITTSICLSCHDGFEVVKQMNHTHLREGKIINSCTRCHNPHVGDTSHFLKGKERQICGACHEKTLTKHNDNLYVHRDISICTNCHEVHGSNNLAMLLGNGNEICTTCHATQGDFSHPVGDGVIDPRNNQIMTCITCHSPKGSDFKYQLKLSGDKELCVQCHKSY